ncbi:hypothetical protein HMPREF1550_01984 [Actinomyces sp. oral taxon 877 str. F0543]|nr:hypothetical protein HMPREF1550_01984 [Actinomyces sp. oral taxon 877 str. F0543]
MYGLGAAAPPARVARLARADGAPPGPYRCAGPLDVGWCRFVVTVADGRGGAKWSAG